jgi:hypothetical protein
VRFLAAELFRTASASHRPRLPPSSVQRKDDTEVLVASRGPSCCCGQLSIEVREPQGVGLCHCLACQTTHRERVRSPGRLPGPTKCPARPRSSSARAIREPSSGFRFCPVCGSNVFHTEEGYEDKWVAVAIGTFADQAFRHRRTRCTTLSPPCLRATPSGVTVYPKDPP